MAENSFIEQYNQSEKLRRGIEAILKSDKYTDEYKALILKFLGENYSAPTEMNNTDEKKLELLDKGGLILEEGKIGLVKITDRKPGLRGRIETPKYIESELIKAVDIVVDELISPPPKQPPLTVPLETYQDLLNAYSASVDEAQDYYAQLLQALSDLDTANGEIDFLNQSLDACEIQRAVAENQSDAINLRYISLLGDFQSAIQKAIQEAIERVSLTAQVRGLQAQKESLKAQLDILEKILVGSTAEQNATAAGLLPSLDSEFFYGGTSNQFSTTWDFDWTTSRDNAKEDGELGQLEIRNLNDNLATIIKVEIIDMKCNQSSRSGDAMLQLGPLGFTPAGYGYSSAWNTPNSAPELVKSVDIQAGATQKFDLFINTFIGGRSKSPINPNESGESAVDYDGTFNLRITFDDGVVSFGNPLTWHVRKNRD